MAAAIRDEVAGAQVELIGGGRGDFIIEADGQRIWDKRAMENKYPTEEDIVATLRRSSDLSK